MPTNQGGIEDLDLLRHAQGNTDEVFNEILLKHRDRLRRMVELRMNQRLKGRLDASDVIQDTFVEATRVVDEYLKNPKMPVFLWLRHLAGEKLIQAHRKHLGAQKRDANREQAIFGGAPAASSQMLMLELSGNFTSPSKVVEKKETADRLMDALESLEELDREVLTMKHFEHLSNKEAAEVLGISYEAVKKRYIRALEKLQKILVG